MAANKKPLYQPWNEEEFQADIYVRGMTWLQKHFYRTLLQAAFFHGTRPYLPNDDEILWILAGCETLEQWVANKDRILRRFTITEIDGVPMLANKRVISDWENLQEIRGEMVALGQRRAAGAERQPNGTFKSGVPVLLNPNTKDEIPRWKPSDGPADNQRPLGDSENSASAAPASKVKVSEVKVSEGKERKENPCNSGGEGFSPKSEWRNMAVRHKRIFGSQASTQHKEKYAEFCVRYSEDVVLECFNDWAADAKEWVATANIKQPLFVFWKKLPDMAETIMAVKDEETAEKVQQETAAEKQKDETAAKEASTVVQAAANWKFLNTPGPALCSEATLEDLGIAPEGNNGQQ